MTLQLPQAHLPLPHVSSPNSRNDRCVPGGPQPRPCVKAEYLVFRKFVSSTFCIPGSCRSTRIWWKEQNRQKPSAFTELKSLQEDRQGEQINVEFTGKRYQWKELRKDSFRWECLGNLKRSDMKRRQSVSLEDVSGEVWGQSRHKGSEAGTCLLCFRDQRSQWLKDREVREGSCKALLRLFKPSAQMRCKELLSLERRVTWV